jgi:hypothetical protein
MAAVVRAIALLALSACVGDVGNGGNGSGSGSGSGSGGIDAAIDAPKLMWTDASNGMGSNLPCKNLATPPGDGHHFPGQSCFQNCHDHGFSVAGTLYTNDTGNTAFPGATITIIDANNQTINMVTNQNGNFYSTANIMWPALVMASACPSAVKMNTAVAATGKACNSCHPSGSTQMHLP